MTRKDITSFLSKTLIARRLSGMGKYYAREVTVDYGLATEKRIDFLQFCPPNGLYVSSVEKGEFICYEIKSCYDDIYSGSGLNFYGEENFIVTTMSTYKKLLPDIGADSNKLHDHIASTNPESSMFFGILVAIPVGRKSTDEFDSPTPLDTPGIEWTLHKMWGTGRKGPRKRSVTEMLFWMVRSGR